MSNDFIPNSFLTPNAYVDKCEAFVTPEEWKVLSYFCRRIFGFNKRQDRVSIGQLADGIKTKGGEQLDYGTGISPPTIRKAVEALCDYGILILVEPNDKTRNEGPLYELQPDSAKIDLVGLMNRRTANTEQARAIMEKVRQSRHPLNAIDPVNVIDPVNATTGGVVNAIEGDPLNATTGGVVNAIATQYTDQNTVQKTDQIKEPVYSKIYPDPSKTLASLKVQLRPFFDQTNYYRKIDPLTAQGWKEGTLRIGTPNEPAQMWLQARARDLFNQQLAGLTGLEELEVEFVLI